MRWLLLLLLLFFTCQPVYADTSTSSQPLQLMPQQNQALQQNGPTGDIMSEEIRDIAGTVTLPEDPIKRFAPWLGGLAALVVIGLIILYFIKRQTPATIKTPAEIALEEMARAKVFLDNEKLAQYAEQLTEILRQYITDRFGVKATSKTTHEFLHHVSQNEAEGSMLQSHQQMLSDCLTRVDLIKFAGVSPDHESISGLEQSVSLFIQHSSSSEEVQ